MVPSDERATETPSGSETLADGMVCASPPHHGGDADGNRVPNAVVGLLSQ